MSTNAIQNDRAECLEQTLLFFRALDARNHEVCAAAFAPSGTWHRQGAALQGEDAVRAALDARPASRVTCHVVTNALAEQIDADRVRVRFVLTAYDGAANADGTPPVPRLAAVMDGTDEYMRTAQGWKIALKSTRPMFRGA